MGVYFSDEFKSYLKSQVPILDLVSQVTTVKKFGNNYLAMCPFHNDGGTPNMQVDPVQNTFFCHSCAAGSFNHSTVRYPDVISFYMNTHNLGFYQTVEALAKMYNVQLPAASQEDIDKQARQKKLSERLATNLVRFQKNLLESKEALAYLSKRGITNTEILNWGLGLGDGQDQDYSAMSGRITFPFYDYFGNLISFTGRVAWEDDKLAIINSNRQAEGKTPYVKYRDSAGFSKNHNLYGLHQAKDSIRKWGVAILLEGWTDTITMHSRGITNAVATMSASLSKEHVSLLKRAGAKSVIIMRDGDLAGQQATFRDAKILQEEGIRPYVFPVPDGMDPDLYARSFKELDSTLASEIDSHKMSFHHWAVLKNWRDTEQTIFSHLSVANNMNMDRRMKVLDNLAQIQDPVERNAMFDTVATLLLVSPQEVAHMLDNHMNKQNQQQQNTFSNQSQQNAYTHQQAFS